MDALGTSESSMRSGKERREVKLSRPTTLTTVCLLIWRFGSVFRSPRFRRCAKLNSPPLVALLRLEQLVRSPFVDDRGEELYANPRLERFSA